MTMLFSESSNRHNQHISSILNLREQMALYMQLDLYSQQQIHLRLTNLAQNNRDILLIGDLLITIYPNLNAEQKSALYQRITLLADHSDFHLRHHSLTLMTLLINNEQLMPEQQKEVSCTIISLCGDRNFDVKFHALNYMLNFFPRLDSEEKGMLFLGIQQDCQDPLDTEIREFAERFLKQNFEYLTHEQRENPLYDTLHADDNTRRRAKI